MVSESRARAPRRDTGPTSRVPGRMVDVVVLAVVGPQCPDASEPRHLRGGVL